MTATQRSRRTQAERRGEAEERIIEAGIRLIEKKGFANFSLGEVGIESGYSRGLPTHHFGKKEELLERIVGRISSDYLRSIQSPGHHERGLPRLKSMIRSYAKFAANREGRVISILLGESVFNESVRKVISFVNEDGLHLLREEIKKGQRLGNISTDIDGNAYSNIIYSFIRGNMSFVVTFDDYDGVAATDEFIAWLEQRIAADPNGRAEKVRKPKSSP